MTESSFDLVSEKCDIASFIEEHAGDPLYQRKLKDLQATYCAVRKTQADGSCFYRGLGFAYLESLLGNQQDILRFRERLVQSRHELLAAGFSEHLFQYHYETFLTIVDMAEKDGSVPNLLKAFNHPDVSDGAIKYLRLVTSAFLRNRAEIYQPFIEDGLHVLDFCSQVIYVLSVKTILSRREKMLCSWTVLHVEPTDAVCDHIQIVALTQALDVPLQVEYVNSADAAVNHHVFPEGARPTVYMLYTRDHYSVLYRAQSQEET